MESISDTIGLPKDSLIFYFPLYSIDSSSKADTLSNFEQNWYSSTLYNFKEPVLSENFIGHEMYRFLWLRSFHNPVVIAIHQYAHEVWLNVKMLDKSPQFYEERIQVLPPDDTEYLKAGYVPDKDDSTILVLKADRKATIIYNKKIELSNKEWTDFEQLIGKAKFWDISNTHEALGYDGSEWIIEAHLQNKYCFVNRWSPNDDFRDLGLYLIKLSGLKEEIY